MCALRKKSTLIIKENYYTKISIQATEITVG